MLKNRKINLKLINLISIREPYSSVFTVNDFPVRFLSVFCYPSAVVEYGSSPAAFSLDETRETLFFGNYFLKNLLGCIGAVTLLLSWQRMIRPIELMLWFAYADRKFNLANSHPQRRQTGDYFTYLWSNYKAELKKQAFMKRLATYRKSHVLPINSHLNLAFTVRSDQRVWGCNTREFSL